MYTHFNFHYLDKLDKCWITFSAIVSTSAISTG